jgi:imidazole glycerol phosphate synthase subunit HisF
MAAMDITANGGVIKPVKFTNYSNSGKPVTGSNGFKSVTCDVSIYQDSTHFNVQQNLGYWATPAPDFLNKTN